MKNKSPMNSSWSYFVEGLDNKKINMLTQPIGLVTNQVECGFKIKAPANVNIEVYNTLDKSIANNVDLTVNGRAVNLNIDLSNFAPEIQIFEVRFLDATSKLKWTLEIAFTPIKQQLPEVTFVIGSPRSGTTAVGKLAQLGFDTNTHGESHVADIFLQMSKIADAHFNHSPASKNNGTLTQELPFSFVCAQLVMNLRELYLRVYRGGAIIDKTPGIKMIESLPMLLRAFPNAKIVYCRRRGIENIASRIRKFKKVPFEGHCKQWVRSIKLWENYKSTLMADNDNCPQFLEIEQLELARNPDKVLSQLIGFLSLPLIKKQKLLNYLEKNSPQRTGSSPKDVYNLDKMDWTDEQKSAFLTICGETMKNQNYSFDEQYYLT